MTGYVCWALWYQKLGHFGCLVVDIDDLDVSNVVADGAEPLRRLAILGVLAQVRKENFLVNDGYQFVVSLLACERQVIDLVVEAANPIISRKAGVFQQVSVDVLTNFEWELDQWRTGFDVVERFLVHCKWLGIEDGGTVGRRDIGLVGHRRGRGSGQGAALYVLRSVHVDSSLHS